MTEHQNPTAPPPTEPPFNTTNAAYQRFQGLIGEHFDIRTFDRLTDGRPVLLVISDVTSGHRFSLQLLESDETTEPHALFVLRAAEGATLYGPFASWTAANSHGKQLTLRTTGVTAIAVARLHDTTAGIPAAREWSPLPPVLAAPAPPPATGPAALLLIDPSGPSAVLIGPFDDPDTARTWPAPSSGEGSVPADQAPSVAAAHDRRVLTLHMPDPLEDDR